MATTQETRMDDVREKIKAKIREYERAKRRKRTIDGIAILILILSICAGVIGLVLYSVGQARVPVDNAMVIIGYSLLACTVLAIVCICTVLIREHMQQIRAARTEII